MVTSRHITRDVRARALAACLVLLLGLGGVAAPSVLADDLSVSRRDRLVSLLEPALAADFHFCEHMGWSFVDDRNVREVVVHTGRPCTRESLRVARARGDLLVRIPATASDALLLEFAKKLPLLAHSVGSRCAYQLRLSVAMDRAMNKLGQSLEKELWTFPQLLIVESPLWKLSPPEPEWKAAKKTWSPRCSPRAAIEAFYTKPAVTECYAGQLLALFTIQYELYGPERFDYAFRADEIVLGRPPLVENVPFGWNTWIPGYHGRRAMFVEGESQNADPALTLAALGPMAFVGMAGIIKDPTGQMMCNENFVLVRISDRAMRDLVKGGGFVAIHKELQKARVLQQEVNNLFTMADKIVENRAKIEEILAQPIFTQLDVFIHPYGVVPLYEIVEEKLRFKTAAISLELYCCGREHAFFQRYRGTFHQLWYAQEGLPMPANTRWTPLTRPPADPRVPSAEARPSPVTLVGCP